MNNDLISRSALIKAVEDEINQGGIDGIVVFGMKKVLEYINNAPTVPPDMAMLLAYEAGKDHNKKAIRGDK